MSKASFFNEFDELTVRILLVQQEEELTLN